MKTVSITLFLAVATTAFVTPPNVRSIHTSTQCLNHLQMTAAASANAAATANDDDDDQRATNKPTSFRDAEVLGLRFMQEGQFDEALKTFQNGMKLPGSRPDVIRTKLLSGPSPVGGAVGGSESRTVLSLDEFELQAAHYNMACAHAQLKNVDESVANLLKAFECGFDNFSTVRGDPDLKPVQGTVEFDDLMEQYDSQKGFNPFGLFKK
mmetsp:Transcript_4358/g.7300  ORF Transcript_4358/g.7300 Transcript_4358/m.7300 type:complete len:209 (-) Transcript_4358:222-848(-)|eukprot:CAMPEP_0119004902 /NCGR_PEP_ID=MMETSP1176-20130426/1421_1 /TAXON_ID=265551 /ORGANISM="Synedropsis recta cf, Strain CCMP1620" /LENGTH=208 /DNA_ID=CAMNT_0006956663 /DNA_START=212 /DNA_END=838 /DNA_ORIENTATION=+